jgi:phage anti-repressor protein
MELIAIVKTEKGTNAVSARELHAGLESKQDFTTWIKKRLDDAIAVEGEDYLLHKKMVQVPHQGGFRNTEISEYIVTIEIAKHIAMMERNEKGKQFRQYFIDFEKEQQAKIPTSPMEIMALIFDQLKVNDQRFKEFSTKIEKLEHSTTLDHAQQQTLQKHVSIRVAELMAKHNLSDSTKPCLFASIYSNLKEKYKVPSYRDITKVRFDEAISDIRKTELKASV